jgi:hypothetical protein
MTAWSCQRSLVIAKETIPDTTKMCYSDIFKYYGVLHMRYLFGHLVCSRPNLKLGEPVPMYGPTGTSELKE